MRRLFFALFCTLLVAGLVATTYFFFFKKVGAGNHPSKPTMEMAKLKVNPRTDLEVSPQSSTTIFEAIDAGDLDLVKSLINSGTAVESRNELGSTTLVYAGWKGRQNIIKFLLLKDAQINATNTMGYTALRLAVEEGHSQVASLLKSRGASNTGLNLISAAKGGDLNLVKSFIAQGVDVNQREGDGTTALLWACKKNHADIIELLLKEGADVELREPSTGNSPLITAAAEGYVSVVHSLVAKKAQIEGTDKSGRTPLQWAAAANKITTTATLIYLDANVNHVDSVGMSALHVACANGFRAIAEALIEAGANLEQHDKDHRTPIMYAALNGESDIVRLLLKSGCDALQRDKFGKNSLDYAMANEHSDTILQIEQYLTEHKVAYQKPGGKLDEIKINPTVSDVEDQPSSSSIFHALKVKFIEYLPYVLGTFFGLCVLWIMINRALKPHLDPALFQYCRERKVLLALGCLIAGANPNKENEFGETPLFEAVMNGERILVRFLWIAGANLDHKNKNDITPVYWAVVNGFSGTLETLLHLGASMPDKSAVALALKKRYVEVLTVIQEVKEERL